MTTFYSENIHLTTDLWILFEVQIFSVQFDPWPLIFPDSIEFCENGKLEAKVHSKVQGASLLTELD